MVQQQSLDPAAPLTPIWVVMGLSMGPAVALGLGRFAYALLLPAMRSELGWSLAQAGAMSTANGAGYLIGAIIAAPWGRRHGDGRLFVWGMTLTAVAIAGSGLTSYFALLLALRFMAGLTGALAFVSGAGLTSASAEGGTPSRAPTLLGVYFAGAGMGILASAIAVPPAIAMGGWRAGWLMLAGLALVATAFGGLALGQTVQPSDLRAGHAASNWSPRSMASAIMAYGLFGAGYVAYATFIIALLRDSGLSGQAVSAFWSCVGVAAMVGGFAWGPLLGRLKAGQGMSATIGVVAIGAATPLLWHGRIGAFLSAVLFGSSFLAVIAAVTSCARRATTVSAWTAAIGILTIMFGLGQCIGPVLSGWLSDGPAGIRFGLWLSVGILVAAAIVAAFQREPEPPAMTAAAWHPGEIALQRRAGSETVLAPLASRIILPHMTEQVRAFFPRLPFVATAYVDEDLWPWGTLLPGSPGFAWSPDPTHLRIDCRAPLGDPFAGALQQGARIGLLGIELPTRRRNRVNGLVLDCDASGFTVQVEQAFGNCPKYIQQRDYVSMRSPPARVKAIAFAALDDARARQVLRQSDTLFVATSAPGPDGPSMDISHRGGRPGFVRVDEDGTLVIPDFAGNRYFNTLGNILVTGRAGLVVPCFATGDVLLLTGDARVATDEESAAELSLLNGAERIWRMKPRQGVWLQAALPLDLQLTGWSPQTLATGTWPVAS